MSWKLTEFSVAHKTNATKMMWIDITSYALRIGSLSFEW